MKMTKIMLAMIATFVITWLFIGFLYYITSDLTYKQCISSDDTIIWVVIVGWIPVIVVASDLVERW
jgi:hypothetical protein